METSPQNNRTPWTYRPGTITSKAKAAIKGLTEINPRASKIFLTGEISGDRLEARDFGDYGYVNKTIGESLFMLRQGMPGRPDSVCMTVFDSLVIWPLLPSAMLQAMVYDEAARFDAFPMELSSMCFYESLFTRLDLWDTVAITNAPSNSWIIYMNALALFRKPGLWEIPASSFFSALNFPISKGRFKTNAEVLAARDALWRKDKDGLTRAEIAFVLQNS